MWPGMPFPNLDGRIHQTLVFLSEFVCFRRRGPGRSVRSKNLLGMLFIKNIFLSLSCWRPAQTQQMMLSKVAADRFFWKRFSAIAAHSRLTCKRRNTRFLSTAEEGIYVTILNTPNSNALKFIPGCDVTKNMNATFTVKKRSSPATQTELNNPLSETLLALDGVSSVM
jgi:hypothetical protein